jgi:lipopolysaccharide export system permease protein
LIVPAYFVLNNEVLPSSNALASYLKRMVKQKDQEKKDPTSTEGLGAWFRDGDRFFQAELLDPNAGTARNIAVFDLDEHGLPMRRGDARAATHIGNGVWRLEDTLLVESHGDRLEILPGPDHAEIGAAIQADVDTRHLSVGDLQREIAEVEASGLDATHYRVDLFVKIASPLACLVLPALALFFAVGGPPHPSSATTLVLSAVVAVAYVLLTGVGTSLGYGGALPPWLAGWSPIALFSTLALYLGLRLRGFGQTLRAAPGVRQR